MSIGRSKKFHRFSILVLILLMTFILAQTAAGQTTPARTPESKKAPLMSPSSLETSLVVEPLSSSLSASDLAGILVGNGITVSNVVYTGENIASGSFIGGDGVVGFDSGILLTSGTVENVVGPNSSDSISSSNGAPGDFDLTTLSGHVTYDASILEFDFVPAADTVFFRYVFASDEYNEFVNSSFNDVFAFFVNGNNCANVENDPVSINQINYGNPYGSEPNSHPNLFINNDVSDGGGAIDTEMDGLTQVLTCSASVNKGQKNTMKLAIADASDSAYDSAVFLEAASLIGANVIELEGLEVTQAIQNWNDNVIMIQDKPTFVRAHVKSVSGTAYNVKARLIGRRGGVPLPGSPLAPANVGGNLDVKQIVNRNTLTDGFFFELPDSWLNGTVNLEFTELTHTVDCKDHADTDNDCKVTVTFIDTPEPEVRIVGIVWNDDGGTHDPDTTDYRAVVQDIEAQYPIDNLDWDRPYELEFVFNGVPPFWLTNLRLGEQRVLDGCLFGCDRIYYGLYVDHPGGDLGAGQASGGTVSSGFYHVIYPTTASHELGHNLGRSHTDCRGDEAGADPDFPYDDGHISQDDTGDNAFFGFHISTRRVFPPETGDLLGYCRPRWISDHNYIAIHSEIDDRFSLANSISSVNELLLVSGDPAVLISGNVSTTSDSGTLETVLQIESPGPVTLPDPGDYSIRFVHKNETLLDAVPFEPDIPEDSSEDIGIFSLMLPWPANTDKIQLFKGSTLLSSRSASQNAPTITIGSPSNGDIWSGSLATISWNASDSDGDELEYTVQYSTDEGASWLTLATGWKTKSFVVNLATLPGSSKAKVRVLATDGFHTAEDESNGTFTVEAHAPEVQIESPLASSIYVEDQTINMRGTYSDAEDGTIPNSSLTWSSNLDGNIGMGESVAINAQALSEGTHIITFMAKDSDGQSGTATVEIKVYRNRPTLAKKLGVSPGAVTISAIKGKETSKTVDVAIRNEGDGTISWETSVDQGWLSLSESIGFTPADEVLTFNTVGLPVGIHTATLTIIGANAQDSPQHVDVELRVNEPVSADFDATPLTGSAPLHVDFSNLSSGDYNSCDWKLGDGTTVKDCADFTHTYLIPGVYTVSLTASGLGGLNTKTKDAYITVENPSIYLPIIQKK